MMSGNQVSKALVLAIVASVSLALGGCGASPETVATTLSKAINEQDLDGALKLFADDAVVTSVGPARFSGKEEIQGWLAEMIADSFHLEIEIVEVSGNRVLETDTMTMDSTDALGLGTLKGISEITVEIGHVVDVVPYAYSGTAELVNNVIKKLDNKCHCYLMQNHGALSLGSDMPRAMKNAELLEHVATIYYHALASGEEIPKLPSAAIDYFADMRKSRFK